MKQKLNNLADDFIIKHLKAMKNLFLLTLIFILNFNSNLVFAQNFQLVWEDQFNGSSLDSTIWNIEDKEGVWNTGANKEFQRYKNENVSVGDDGNGNNCLILTAKKETVDGYNYTSGRVNTKGKLAFRRGKIEAMIKIPDLSNGLWPAFWTLGYTSTGWPDCGEIDIMEMGHAKGIQLNKPNSYMGAHLFWGPYPRDYGTNYTASEDLSSGYFKHTCIWTEESIAVYFNDAKTPYFSMGIDGDDTEEFRNFQHYILFNLAVGGSVPGITDEALITANFPASMYVDWVKVYQDKDDLDTDNLPLFGTFGILEEKPDMDIHMKSGYDLEVTALGLETDELAIPYWGDSALAYKTSGGNFQLKLSALLNRNMSNYAEGSIQFYIKTDITEPLQIGIEDKLGQSAFITFTNDGSHQIERNNEWHLAYIALNELKDKVDLTHLKSMLIVKGDAESNSSIQIDEIVYAENIPHEGYYGIYSNNTNLPAQFEIDDKTGHIYIWSNTIVFNNALSAYEGESSLSFRSTGAANWWGFGIYSDAPLNFENYKNGYLHLALRTSTDQNFTITMNGASDTKGEIVFKNNSDPYNFKRDGQWHLLVIPMSDLVAQGLDLSACKSILSVSGGQTSDIGLDDVYLSETGKAITNPMVCYPASIELLPKNPTVRPGRTKRFTATLKDQFNNKTTGTVVYSTEGAEISEDGVFSANQPGEYIIWAQSGDLSDSSKVFVEDITGIKAQDDELRVTKHNQEIIEISCSENIRNIQIYSLSGSLLLRQSHDDKRVMIDLSPYSQSIYLINVQSQNNNHRLKINK